VSEQTKALIVVDVQNDFCPGGSLAVASGDEVVAPLNELAKEFLDRGEPVFKTRDWHPARTKHFAAYGGTWPIHCVQGTRGAQFHADLIDDPRITIISKGTDESADGYSGFDGTNLAQLLREEGVAEVWVGGLATDYCVKHTVLDARREGFEVKALADAMRAVNLKPNDGRQAIEEMRDAGAEIVGNTASAFCLLPSAFCFLLTDYRHLCLQSSLASLALRSQIFRSLLKGISRQASFFTL